MKKFECLGWRDTIRTANETLALRFFHYQPSRKKGDKYFLMKDLPKASFYQIALVFSGDLYKYVCDEKSMNPTIKDGEVVLVDKNARDYKVGDIVLAKHPIKLDLEVVKRIERINEKGHYFLIGDNLEKSEDSRHYGAITREYIKGKVVARSV